MIKNFLFLLLTLTAFNASAKEKCSPDLNSKEALLQSISTCQEEAETKKLSHLPRYIQERVFFCEKTKDSEKEIIDCMKELITFSSNVLSCSQSPIYKNQMASYDRSLFTDMIKTYGPATIPVEIQTRLALLKEAALKIKPEAASLPWTFNAYKANFLNAHAGADSQIMLSSGLWAENSALNLDEISAVVAHELSHVLQDHSLRLGCLALEWVGSSLDLQTAMNVFREDFSTVTERGVIWSEMSQGFEYQADAMATTLLKKAGLNPRLMGDALDKMKPKNGGGFSSGSHPEMDVRIKAAYREAEKINN